MSRIVFRKGGITTLGPSVDRQSIPPLPLSETRITTPPPDARDTENSESTSDEELDFLHEVHKPSPDPEPRGRRSSFLGSLAAVRKSPSGGQLVGGGGGGGKKKTSPGLVLDDFFSQTQARRLAACIKELKEGHPEELVLTDMKLSARDVKRLFSAVKKYYRRRHKNERSLRSLELRNCGVDDHVCNVIADAILSIGFSASSEAIPGLQKLDLSNNDITTRGALLILGALKQNVDLTDVILSGNDIAEGVSRWLSDQLKTNSQLRKDTELERSSSLRRINKREKHKSTESLMPITSTMVSFDFDKHTPPNVAEMRSESEKLTTQLQGLRAEIKRLEAKRSRLKKSSSKSSDNLQESRDSSPPDSPTFLDTGNMFKLVDSSKIKIGRRIAALGGSGASIFEAEVDGWTCAVKEIVNIKYMNKATISSFEREIKIMGSLPSHPNVCRYLFASREENTIRLFMSLYHGTLASVVRSKVTAIQKAEAQAPLIHQSSLSKIFSVLAHQGSSDSDASWTREGTSTGSSSSYSSPSSVASSPVPSFLASLSPRGEKTSSGTPRSGKSARSQHVADRVAAFIESQYFQAKQIQFYALEIASGLEFLHANNIIHRDIKCENVFVQFDMENNIKNIAIGDFDTALNTLLYRPRTVCGTTAFMAPEVFRGQEYDLKADIFSFGVVLYRLLTFELPWGRQITVVNYEEKFSKPIEYPSRLVNGAEYASLVRICTKCLSLDPNDRPSAKQLRELLMAA